MSFSRPVIALLGAGVLGIALVGVGAAAQFTTSVSSTQKITAGTLSMSVWTPQATNGCTAASNHCSSVTLPDVGPVGSTFATKQIAVNVTNTGNVPATFNAFQLSVKTDGTAAGAALLKQTDVCLISTDSPSTPNHSSWVEGNGPLTTAINLHPTVQENGIVVKPGATVKYGVIFYAGENTATPPTDRSSTWPNLLPGCGTIISDGTHTHNAWWSISGNYTTPPSLTNAAQGGSMTPKVTFSFTG